MGTDLKSAPDHMFACLELAEEEDEENTIYGCFSTAFTASRD
jgi:hypothetical protein